MSILESQRLADLQVANQEIPSEGPRDIPLLLDFSSVTDRSFTIALLQQQVQTRISMVQTIYIDLADSDNVITVIVENTNHRVRAKGRTQGFYTLLAPAPTTLKISSSGTDVIPVHMVNVPIAGVVWATQ
jgi:hypothetical protein